MASRIGPNLGSVTTHPQPMAATRLRGRPLMIGGRRKDRKWIYFFLRKCLLRIIFPGEGLLRFVKIEKIEILAKISKILQDAVRWILLPPR